MLSYRHHYHAGNAADVLKHLGLVLILDHLRRKPAPFAVFDGHAGAGDYALAAASMQKHREFDQGIGRLIGAADRPPAVARYCEVTGLTGERLPETYPGSPAISRALLREHDALTLLELHPADFARLDARYGRDPQVHLHQRDVHEGLPALVPPHDKAIRRGLIILDPAYELREDYRRIPELLRKVHRKWATATTLIWYPILSGAPERALIRSLESSGLDDLLQLELRNGQAAIGRGSMLGSGLIVHQGPWTLAGEFEALLPWLCARLATGPDAAPALRWLRPAS